MSFIKKLFKSKDEPIKNNNDFWNWFLKHEKNFHKIVKSKKNIESQFFDKLSPKLAALKDGFYFLTGMKDKDIVELIFTADGNINNIIFVEELVKNAPKITGWLFVALKPAIDKIDFGIAMNNYKFDTKNIHFYANSTKNLPDIIDITIVHDDLNKKNEKQIINGSYIFLDNYIGELKLATVIDYISFKSKKEAKETLVPITKLNDFLIWRQKEFLEKHEGIRHHTKNDNYGLIKGELENGNALIAVINTDLLNWDSKASHPWILEIKFDFKGINNSGMPSEQISKLLNKIEEQIMSILKDQDGYLNIGRETLSNNRYVYFACKDFRKPSKILFQIQKQYQQILTINYEIYKDKYWQSFNRFIQS